MTAACAPELSPEDAIAIERAGGLPAWRVRPDVFAPPLPPVLPRRPAGLDIIAGEGRQQQPAHLVAGHVVVRRGAIRSRGRQAQHEPAARDPHQFQIRHDATPQLD